MRVSRVVPHTVAEGPGSRFAVWFQGCSLECAGCFNPQLWPTAGGADLSAAALFSQLNGDVVEGVTLLGGEPFEQAAQVAQFAEMVRGAGLSVMTFTGYTLERLRARSVLDPGIGRLLAATDLLVDGPYLVAKPDRLRPWVGSTNQRFHHLSDRYRHLGEHLEYPDRIEVRISADGTATVNGWAETAQLEDLLAGLPVRRSDRR